MSVIIIVIVLDPFHTYVERWSSGDGLSIYLARAANADRSAGSGTYVAIIHG